jgi:hypothetical protein
MGWVEDVVNVGYSVWEVIDGEKPSTDIDQAVASALPSGADFTQVGSPAGTKSIYRQVVMWNDRGNQAVHVGWNLNWEYGSTYKGGGAFIPRAWITAAFTPEVIRGWHVKVDATFDSPTVEGAGTAKPIARLPVKITRTVRSFGGVTDDQAVYEFVLYGDGRSEVTKT